MPIACTVTYSGVRSWFTIKYGVSSPDQVAPRHTHTYSLPLFFYFYENDSPATLFTQWLAG